jgi:hypothetical protein
MSDKPRILYDDEAEEEFGHLTLRDPEEMRRQNEEATKRLRQYIKEHKGNLLALDLCNMLLTRYGRD